MESHSSTADTTAQPHSDLSAPSWTTEERAFLAVNLYRARNAPALRELFNDHFTKKAKLVFDNECNFLRRDRDARERLIEVVETFDWYRPSMTPTARVLARGAARQRMKDRRTTFEELYAVARRSGNILESPEQK